MDKSNTQGGKQVVGAAAAVAATPQPPAIMGAFMVPSPGKKKTH